MVRKADSDDALGIFSIDSTVFTDSLGFNFINNDLRENPMAHYYVCEINDKIVGFISAWISDNTSILDFAVIEEYRGKGIGQELFNRLLKDSVGILTLEVRESNKLAIKFYQRNGFTAESIRYHYYDDGENAILMVRR